ncbi:MAG TPA: hypothetical protein VF744_20635 [Beijerinckiaceae bacterium]|jgi:hypothetical protein
MSHLGIGTSRLLAAAFCLASATPAAAQSIGDTLSNLFKFGGTTEPKEAPRGAGDAYCPTVGVIEGGAALRAYTGGKVGEPSALRHQIAIGQLARECVEQPDGSILIKVGVEGRALLGPAGQPGRFDAPVTFVVKRGERVFASRTQRVSVAVPAGDTQASFVTVQDGLVVPPGVGEYEIDVGLGAGAGEKPERPARRKRG